MVFESEQTTKPSTKFDFVEDEASEKVIYTIFGHKGCGKTTTAFLFKTKFPETLSSNSNLL